MHPSAGHSLVDTRPKPRLPRSRATEMMSGLYLSAIEMNTCEQHSRALPKLVVKSSLDCHGFAQTATTPDRQRWSRRQRLFLLIENRTVARTVRATHLAGLGQALPCGDLRLGKRGRELLVDAHDLAGGAHLGAQQRVGA